MTIFVRYLVCQGTSFRIIALHQRIRTIPNVSNPERQFLNRGLCAMQTLKAGFIPAPQDAFSMTDFDVVIYHDRELGKGGFGAVFEGNWHGTKVAIKRIRNFHPAFGANEINIMKRLKHDHVLQIFGANLNSNQLFLVCALKSQGDVCMFLHNNPSAKRRKLCHDVSLGLAYLHENSVIHGDIKPQNILIDENGIPCLCDFGLSRIRTLFTHAPTTPLDEEGAPIGTFQYMSPEQMVYGTTDEASDVYSFGMTIYEIFSGDIPFKDVSCWSLLRSNVVEYANRPAKPQPQADIDREFDDKLWSLIEECWSQEPSNRPTAATVSLRLGDVNGCLVQPAEMYKKEIADLTEELASVKEKCKVARQEYETELAKLRDSFATRELEEAEPKKDLDEERDLRKPVEKKADERSKAAREDLETELAKLRNSLARRELEKADLKKDLNGERDLRERMEKYADELRAQLLQSFSKEERLTGDQDDVVIVVMGATGAGKTSFIKLLTGNTSINLDYETCNVQILHFRDPDSGRKVTIVDTPGFDFDGSTNLNDTDALKRIVSFLLREYDQNRTLSGLIYVQQISGYWFNKHWQPIPRMFRELCGPAAFKNVVVLTTHWDEVPTHDEGVEREAKLKSNFRNLVEGGAQFMRHDRTVEGARKVLRHILPMHPTVTQIQTEIWKEGESLIETAAGSIYSKRVEGALAFYKLSVDLVAKDIRSDKAARQMSGTILADYRDILARLERGQAELKKGLDEERGLRMRLEKKADELRNQYLQQIQSLSKEEQANKLRKHQEATREAVHRALREARKQPLHRLMDIEDD